MVTLQARRLQLSSLYINIHHAAGCGYASVIHFCASKSCFYTFPSDDPKITCIYITLPITGRWECVIGRKLSSGIISALLFIRDHFPNSVVIVHFLSIFATSFAQPNEISIEIWAGTVMLLIPPFSPRFLGCYHCVIVTGWDDANGKGNSTFFY